VLTAITELNVLETELAAAEELEAEAEDEEEEMLGSVMGSFGEPWHELRTAAQAAASAFWAVRHEASALVHESLHMVSSARHSESEAVQAEKEAEQDSRVHLLPL
jgi:hypothetical protein